MAVIDEFTDDLPASAGRYVNSKAVVEELKQKPGKWGRFYSQSDEERQRAIGRVSTLKIYVNRHSLPVDVQQISDEEGRVHGWARWRKEASDS